MKKPNWTLLVLWLVLLVMCFLAATEFTRYTQQYAEREHRAQAASADCAKWLAQAEYYANLRIMGSYSGQAGAVSSAYSLLAIAHGCNR